jgi:cytochrome c556
MIVTGMAGLRRGMTAAALATLIGVGYAPPATAHKGATGVVMHRMHMMKALAKAMKDMAAMLKGKQRYDPARFAMHAAAIRKHAADLPKMFPKGSNPKPSEALPGIWQDWDGFLVRLRAMDTAAAALAAVTMEGRKKVLKEYIGVAKSCTGCHTVFRKRK